jgi:hypothetical protein
MALDPGHALATLVAQLTGSNSTGKVSYITEGGLYQEAGPRSFAVRARLRRRTNPTSSWRNRNSMRAMPSSAASQTGSRHERR